MSIQSVNLCTKFQQGRCYEGGVSVVPRNVELPKREPWLISELNFELEKAAGH